MRAAAAHSVYLGLLALQHRGQESCGIAVGDGGEIQYHKALGLVGDALDRQTLDKLGEGRIAVGHVRYSTTGGNNARNIQPLVISHGDGNFVLAHNGNLVNAMALRGEYEHNGAIFHGTSDTETIA